MTHYRMMDRVPSCVILHNRNELKLYNGNIVYLNDGDNFELRFFNPLQQKIGVEIMFNGLKKGDAYLVLNPGQDVILDRFLDEQRKMLFETYVIDGNNSDAVKAAERNGVINFNFYKERGYMPHHYSHYYSGSGTYGMSGISGASGTSGTGGIGHYKNVKSTKSSNSNSRMYGRFGMHDPNAKWAPIVEDESSRGVFTQSLNSLHEEYFDMDESVSAAAPLSAPVETGRIEMGDVSDQQLKNVNVNFDTMPFYSVTYKMLPFSSKATEIQEVRMYCGDCGYRVRKQSYKFCPKCGSKLL